MTDDETHYRIISRYSVVAARCVNLTSNATQGTKNANDSNLESCELSLRMVKTSLERLIRLFRVYPVMPSEARVLEC